MKGWVSRLQPRRLIFGDITIKEEEDAERGAMIKMAEKFDRSPGRQPCMMTTFAIVDHS